MPSRQNFAEQNEVKYVLCIAKVPEEFFKHFYIYSTKLKMPGDFQLHSAYVFLIVFLIHFAYTFFLSSKKILMYVSMLLHFLSCTFPKSFTLSIESLVVYICISQLTVRND